MGAIACSTGWFDVELYDPDGSRVWRKRIRNGTTTGGLNDMLNVAFVAGTQKTTWYLGLVNNAAFTSFAVGDTMSSHSGWTESTDYAEATRPQWTSGSAASGSVTNSSTVNFTINATVTIKGIFVTSSSTKGGTAGTLWATGAFDTAQAMTSGQVLKVTYTTTLT